MTYLVDTHTLLWCATEPEKLSRSAAEIVYDFNSVILVSTVVPWELAIKTNTGKLDAAKLITEFEQRMLRLGFLTQQIETSHAIRSGLLPFHHRDPFDRLLAAQSLEMNVPILSRDRQLDLYGVHRIW